MKDIWNGTVSSLKTYNFDVVLCLEVSGIPEEKLVEAHGGFSTASCIRCFKKHDPHKTREDILQGKIVYCDRSLCKVRIYLHLKHVWMYQRNETILYGSGMATLFKSVCHIWRRKLYTGT